MAGTCQTNMAGTCQKRTSRYRRGGSGDIVAQHALGHPEDNQTRLIHNSFE